MDPKRTGGTQGGDEPAVLLIDGVCSLCHGISRFVAKRDPQGRFRFAALQSETGRRLLAEVRGQLPAAGLPDSFVLLEGGRLYVKSTAALRVVRRLRGGWPLLYAAIALPAALRDRIYDFVAARRYRWFGRNDVCMVPPPALRERFLDQGEGE